MRICRPTASLLLLALAVAGAPARAQDERPDALVVEASVAGGRIPQSAALRIAADGATNVRLETWDRKPRISLDLTLTADERADLRRRVEESRFFDEWTKSDVHVTHSPTWTVTIVLGAREMRRTIRAQDAFRPVESFLGRVIRQAETAADLRAGSVARLANALGSPEHQGVIHPAELVPDLVDCVVTTSNASHAAEGAALLTAMLPAEAWRPRVTEVLSRTGGDRRDAVLVRWADETSKAGRDAHRAAFAPIALAEVRLAWKEWTTLSERRRQCLRTLLGLSLEQAAPGALGLAEEMVRTLAPGNEQFVPPSLARIREAAIPMTLRLLDDASPEVRASAVWMAHVLIETAKPLRPREDGVTGDERTALAEALRVDLVAALERRANAEDEVLETRNVAHAALRIWQGRDDAAERRARREDDRRRRAADDARRGEADSAEAQRREAERRANAPPKGDLAITGRVLGQDDAPLPEMTVVAQRPDGPPENPWRFHGSAKVGADGSFRIEGLVAGEFDLTALRDGQWGWREYAGNASALNGVRAGTDDIVLRFPGGMLRGRIVGADAKPLAKVPVRALLRDIPDTLPPGALVHDAWAETDADGRFLVLQLLPGIYDVTVPGRPFLRGASGLEPGPGAKTIEVVAGGTISGRVLDASGAAIAGAGVGARPAGTHIDGIAGTAREDGTFTIAGLDPAFRYVVGASVSDGPPYETRSVAADDVAVGTSDLVLRIDTGPEVAGTVEIPPGRRSRAAEKAIRLVRIAGGDPVQRDFAGPSFRWRGAPAGTWRVLAHVRDLDASGAEIDVWREVGTIGTGDAARTFIVPR